MGIENFVSFIAGEVSLVTNLELDFFNFRLEIDVVNQGLTNLTCHLLSSALGALLRRCTFSTPCLGGRIQDNSGERLLAGCAAIRVDTEM